MFSRFPRPISIAGGTLLGLVSLAAPLAHQGTPQLIDAVPCAALPETLAVWIARLWPASSPFLALARVDDVLLVLGTAWLGLAIWRASGHPIAAALVAAASWLAPDWRPVLRPLDTLALPLAAALCWFVASPERGLATHAGRVRVWAVLAVMAAMYPTTALPVAMAFAVAVLCARSGGTVGASGVGGVGLLCVAALSVALAPSRAGAGSASLSACLMPSAAGARDLAALVSTAGPLVAALALFGSYSRGWPLTRDRLAMGVAVAVPLAAVALVGGPHAVIAIVVPIWILAGVGIDEVWLSVPASRRFWAASALTVFVPLFAWQAWTDRGRIEREPDYGHRSLSLSRFAPVVAAMPPGSAVAGEDAGLDILWRAARVPPATALLLPTGSGAVTAALSRGDRPVFALPRAQAELAHLGFDLDRVAPGVARVTSAGDCRIATADWRELPNIVGRRELGLVARSTAEYGPIVIYTAYARAPVLEMIDWPVAARRGFYITVYDTSAKPDREALFRDSTDDRLPRDQFDLESPFIGRLELWRTPTAPLRLAVRLGEPPRQVLAKVIARSDPKRLSVCGLKSFTPVRF